MAKIDLILSADFFQETPDLKLSGNLDLGLFPEISAGKLRSYAFWKFRSYSITANFPRETSDLTLPGNLDLIPFWQNLNFSQKFSPGNLRSDAFRDYQRCSVLFQSCFSLKQSCFRAVQGCFPLIQRCSALVKMRHILVWNSKNTLINTTFALFSVHFLLKTLNFSLFTILHGTCDKEAWGRGGRFNSNFWPEFRRNDFFHSWYTPKEHVFRDPNTFSNLYEAFSSVSHFVLIQHWTALIQRKAALNSSETALISAGFLNPFWNSADQRWNFWNLWNSADQRWFALGLQPGMDWINFLLKNLLFSSCTQISNDYWEKTILLDCN